MDEYTRLLAKIQHSENVETRKESLQAFLELTKSRSNIKIESESVLIFMDLILRNQNNPSIVCDCLEILTNLIKPPTAAQGQQSLGYDYALTIITHGGIQHLTTLLESKQHFVQLFSLLLMQALFACHSTSVVDGVVVNRGIAPIVNLVRSSNDALRNESIDFLTSLCDGNHPLQSVVCMQGAFEACFSVLFGCETDDPIIETTFKLILTLLSSDIARKYFRQENATNLKTVLSVPSQALPLRYDSPRWSFLFCCLDVVCALCGGSSEELMESQKIFIATKAINDIMQISLFDDTPEIVRCASILSLAALGHKQPVIASLLMDPQPKMRVSVSTRAVQISANNVHSPLSSLVLFLLSHINTLTASEEASNGANLVSSLFCLLLSFFDDNKTGQRYLSRLYLSAVSLSETNTSKVFTIALKPSIFATLAPSFKSLSHQLIEKISLRQSPFEEFMTHSSSQTAIPHINVTNIPSLSFFLSSSYISLSSQPSKWQMPPNSLNRNTPPLIHPLPKVASTADSATILASSPITSTGLSHTISMTPSATGTSAGMTPSSFSNQPNLIPTVIHTPPHLTPLVAFAKTSSLHSIILHYTTALTLTLLIHDDPLSKNTFVTSSPSDSTPEPATSITASLIPIPLSPTLQATSPFGAMHSIPKSSISPRMGIHPSPTVSPFSQSLHQSPHTSQSSLHHSPTPLTIAQHLVDECGEILALILRHHPQSLYASTLPLPFTLSFMTLFAVALDGSPVTVHHALRSTSLISSLIECLKSPVYDSSSFALLCSSVQSHTDYSAIHSSTPSGIHQTVVHFSALILAILLDNATFAPSTIQNVIDEKTGRTGETSQEPTRFQSPIPREKKEMNKESFFQLLCQHSRIDKIREALSSLQTASSQLNFNTRPSFSFVDVLPPTHYPSHKSLTEKHLTPFFAIAPFAPLSFSPASLLHPLTSLPSIIKHLNTAFTARALSGLSSNDLVLPEEKEAILDEHKKEEERLAELRFQFAAAAASQATSPSRQRTPGVSGELLSEGHSSTHKDDKKGSPPTLLSKEVKTTRAVYVMTEPADENETNSAREQALMEKVKELEKDIASLKETLIKKEGRIKSLQILQESGSRTPQTPSDDLTKQIITKITSKGTDRMSRHSLNKNTRPIFLPSERAEHAFRSKKMRVIGDGIKSFDSCSLCLNRVREPKCCLEGHIFCNECILQNGLKQKRMIKQKQLDHQEYLRRKALSEKKKEQEKSHHDSTTFLITDSGRTTLSHVADPINVPSDITKSKRSASWMDVPDFEEGTMEEPSKDLVCPGHDHKLELKRLISIHFSEMEGKGEGKETLFNCFVCKTELTNSADVFVIRECGHAICGDCIALLQEEMKKSDGVGQCPVCLKQTKLKSLVQLEKGGTGFSQHDKEKSIAKKDGVTMML
ncbi:putative E3 ubiquitin-protein ligase CSU1 [Blattamonas nauphoetae]|uniref:E3 ubiquitin-protein ligase CSU1 n=1 Tax=Blattamonas nauphoetae TaxID=2049346 RepID=A0ABQ9YAV7_9EUKA|nr:putative E3 ubiquitin-protein ligase CSU1 [Blattamonas nauphoetae]